MPFKLVECVLKGYSQRTSIADGGGVEKPPPGNQSSIVRRGG